MNLCQYKHLLGVPKKGIHSYRFFGIAIMDVIQTILAAFIISYFLRLPFLWTLLYLFLLGEFLHYIFCVESTIMLFFFPKGFS